MASRGRYSRILTRITRSILALVCVVVSGLASGSGADTRVQIRFTSYSHGPSDRITATAGGSAVRVVSATPQSLSRPILIVIDPNSYGRQELRTRLARFGQALAAAGSRHVRLGIPVLDGILGPELGERAGIVQGLDQVVLKFVPEQPVAPLTAGRTLDFIAELLVRAEKEAGGPVDCLLLFRDRKFDGEGSAYLNEGMIRRLAASAFRGSTLYGWIDGDGILRRACGAAGGIAWGTDAPAAEVLAGIAAARRNAIALEIEFPQPEQGGRIPLEVHATDAASQTIRLRAPEAFWSNAGDAEPPDHERMQQGLASIRRALEALADGNATLARRFGESAIRSDSWNPEAYSVAASAVLELGDVESALSLGRQGIAATGPDERIVTVLAAACRRAGQAAQALPRLRALADSVPSPSPALRLEMARLHAAAEDLARAREIFSENLNGSRDAAAVTDYGDVLLRLGIQDEGRAQLTRAIDIDPNNSRAMLMLARSLTSTGDTAAARGWAEKALERDSGDPDAQAGLAAVQGSLGEWDAAAESMQRALVLAPGRREFRQQYAAILCHAHREQEAASFLRRGIQSDPSDATAYRTLGEILSRTGAVGEAAGVWEDGASRAGHDAHELFRMAAEMRERRGEYGQALLNYRAMLRAVPPEAASSLQSELQAHLSAISLLVGPERRPDADPVIRELGVPAIPKPASTGSATVDPGTIEVPGGLALLARTIGLGEAPGGRDALERIFTLILDNVSPTGTRLRDEPLRRDAVTALRTHAALIRHLEKERLLPSGFDSQNPKELTFLLYDPGDTTLRARRLLRFFGVSLSVRKGRDGGPVVTLVFKQGSSAAARQQVLRNMGVNLTDRGLREIRFTPRSDRAPILLRPDVWRDRILPGSGQDRGLLERFLLSPRAMRLYLALAGCSESARAGLVDAFGPGELLGLVEALSNYGRYLDFRDGKLVFPGDQKSWEALLGAGGPGSPPAITALLRRDDWRALRMYASLSVAPESVRRYLTATPQRLQRLHDIFHGGSRPNAPAGFAPPDLGRTLSLLYADESGLLLPIDRRLAPALFQTAAGSASGRASPGGFEPIQVRDQDLARLLEWAGTLKSQISLSPLEAVELICWLQSAHPEMLDEETAAAIMDEPVAAASMIDIVVDLSPPAPLLKRYFGLGHDLANQGPRAAGRMRTSQALVHLLSLLQRQGAVNPPEALKLFDSALTQLSTGGDAAFAQAVARFLYAELVPVLRRQYAGGDADETLFAALAGPPQKQELAYEGRALQLDAPAYQLRRMRSAIMHQSYTPLDHILEAFRVMGDRATTESLGRAVSLVQPIASGSQEPAKAGIAAADLQKLQARIASAGRSVGAASEQLSAEVAQALNVELGVTLLAFCYAFHGAPEADVLAFDPVFIRKHDFYASEPGGDGPWGVTRLEQRPGTGSYCIGSLSGLGFELSRLETAQWAQNLGDGEQHSMLPTILSGMRSIRRSQRTERAQEYVALAARLGRELLAASETDPATRDWCEEYLHARLLPRRRDEVLEALASGSPVHAAAMLSPSELFQLGREWLLQRSGTTRPAWPAASAAEAPALSSPVVTRLAALSPAPEDQGFRSELDQYGIFLRRRLGISKTSTGFADSYEQLDRVGREYAIYERMCDLKIRIAELQYALGIPAFVDEVEGEIALQEVLPRGAHGTVGTWKTALEEIGRLRPENARGWIQELVTRGVLAVPDRHSEDSIGGVASAP